MTQLRRGVWPIVGGMLLLVLARGLGEAHVEPACGEIPAESMVIHCHETEGNVYRVFPDTIDWDQDKTPRSCDLAEMLRLTRWYVAHVRPDTAPSPWVSTVCGCDCLDGSARSRCLADEEEVKERRQHEQQQKRSALLRVLEQCEKRQSE